MNNFLKATSTILFAVIIIGFAFPFTNTIYQNGDAIALTGLDILQSTIQPLDREETEPSNSIPSTPTITNENTITLSALSASIGVATSSLKSARGAVITAIISGIGTASLWLFKDSNDRAVFRQENGAQTVEFGSGFFTTFSSYIAAFIANILRLLFGTRSKW